MIKEFEIFIPDEKIELLNRKIDLTRWPDEINDEKWTLGAKKSYLQEAVETWRNSFDWRKHETKLNEAGSFKYKTVSGLELHYLHKKSGSKMQFHYCLHMVGQEVFKNFLRLCLY